MQGLSILLRKTSIYRTVLPEHCTFNFDISVDVIFILQQPTLHAVFKQTYFYRAAVVHKMYSFTLWAPFMAIRAIFYHVVPYKL